MVGNLTANECKDENALYNYFYLLPENKEELKKTLSKIDKVSIVKALLRLHEDNMKEINELSNMLQGRIITDLESAFKNDNIELVKDIKKDIFLVYLMDTNLMEDFSAFAKRVSKN